ncbi:hypothetical protein [Mycoavidus cysteinexigens]|uniref:hypothetical protein n=1 Tax=Mycoavidus cysteinexigens TaxID=1553431 RepID=UPI001375F342|nr:hypothetical protein [Mycoavidus cysteinexigens]
MMNSSRCTAQIGSALYISLAGEDPETPLEIKRIRQGALQSFIALDRHQLTVDKLY